MTATSPGDIDHDGLGDRALAQTHAWVEHAVIGLGLCPFAKAVVVRRQVRFVVSMASDDEGVRADLIVELAALAAADPAELDTTLLICAGALADFDGFNQFLDIADDAVRGAGLEGDVQIASFHPHYRFAGTEPGDITNATNRSPWPVLQLLREGSVEGGTAALDDPDEIYEANMKTLDALGTAGWLALSERWARSA